MMIHVTPINDDKEHTESEFCECKPTLKDGVYIHNAWDFREVKEYLEDSTNT
jgi:hypothetical protein